MPDQATTDPWAQYAEKPGGDQWAQYAEKPPAAEKKEEPGFLDKEIPLTSYGNATLSGLQSLGRGVRDAFAGTYQAVRHPVETVKSIADFPYQAAQVPAAIHDINQSPDPVGTYAKVGQETAGQGFGQAAVTGLGDLAVGAAPAAWRFARPAIRTGLQTVADIVDPDLTGVASPRLAHMQRLAGKVARNMGGGEDSLVYRDATHLNKIPYAGEEYPPALGPGDAITRYRDATKLNVPYAGEEMPDEGLQPYRDATRLNVPYAGEEYPAAESTALARRGRPGAGRLVLMPEEAMSEDQLQAIAKARASQRGMRYAGGMKPRGTLAQIQP